MSPSRRDVRLRRGAAGQVQRRLATLCFPDRYLGNGGQRCGVKHVMRSNISRVVVLLTASYIVQ